MSLQWVRIGALALVGVVLTLTGVLLYGVADLKFGGYAALGGLFLALVSIGLAEAWMRRRGSSGEA
jgi:hypothetical protein